MASHIDNTLFGGKRFAAFLFDMDGTILTSLGIAERIWGEWAVRHGIAPESFLPTIHGVRATETIARQNLPDVDVWAEAQSITEAEIADVNGVEAIEGVRAFLLSLPVDRWAVVTSAPLALAQRRIEAANLPLPRIIVAAEDVVQGKPSPEGYLLAATKLGVNASDCLVFEDAPAGVKAGNSAGSQIMVIISSNGHQNKALTDYTGVVNYSGIFADTNNEGIQLRQTDVLFARS
ncbi:HAD-IA family hydrolase [Klebsiella aerogenes]|nr:HAD-IA family hydrolase [Klebsiella aerogenes]